MDSQSRLSSSATCQENTLNSSTIINGPSASISHRTTQISSTNSINKPLQHLILLFPTTTRKRKGQPLSSASASAIRPPTRQKKTKTIINCPVALTLLKELGLGRPFFNSGEVLAWGLEPTDPVFLRIQDYVYQGQRNNKFGAKVLKILRIMSKVDNLQDAAIPADFNEDPRNAGQLRKMLWHGTGSDNVSKILQNGLILPKNRGGFYGRGIYFSDSIDLSLCFCRNRSGPLFGYFKAGNKGYLFLCDVLLGNDIYKTTSITGTNQIKLNWPWQPLDILTAKSIQGIGTRIPNPEGDQLIDSCVWPMGEGMEDMSIWFTLLHRNIYCVYDEMRVIPKYLVQVEFTDKSVVSKKLC